MYHLTITHTIFMPYNPIPWVITIEKPLKLQRCYAVQVIKFHELIHPLCLLLPPSLPTWGKGTQQWESPMLLAKTVTLSSNTTYCSSLSRNLPDQYLWTACNLISSYNSIWRGPMFWLLNIEELYIPKMERVLSS